MTLLDPNQSYTFSKYFELGFEASELAAEFGYQFIRRTLNLPQFSGELGAAALSRSHDNWHPLAIYDV